MCQPRLPVIAGSIFQRDQSIPDIHAGEVGFQKWMQVCLLAILMVMSFGLDRARAQASLNPGEPAAGTVTNVAQLCDAASRQERVNCSVRIEGVVRWTSQGLDQVMIQDPSGVVAVKLDLSGASRPQPGQKIRLEGTCLAGRGGIAATAFLENDGLHFP
jgi:hypothetical protein